MGKTRGRTRPQSATLDEPLLLGPANLDEPELKREEVVGLRDARVVWADDRMLDRDFRVSDRAAPPGLAPGATAGERLDAWLLSECAWLSTSQAGQDTVNSAPHLSGTRRSMFRPPGYGRALVTRVDGGGLMDLKGVGTAPGVAPRYGIHSNGLLSLWTALEELALERLTEAVFRRSRSGFRCVPAYAVLDLGFDLRSPEGQTTPAGLLARRAHRRGRSGVDLAPSGSPRQLVQLEIELLLRHFGLTSDSPSSRILICERAGQMRVRYGPRWMDELDERELRRLRELSGFRGEPMQIAGVNVQLTRDVGLNPSRATVVDFGHFNVRRRFDEPILSMVGDRLLHWGGLLTVDDPRYVQPRPGLALPYKLWGAREDCVEPGSPAGTPPEKRTRVQRLCMELAHGFRAGSVDRAGVEARLRELLDSTWT